VFSDRTISESFNRHTHQGRGNHRSHQYDRETKQTGPGGKPELEGQKITNESADHINVAVREVDQPQDAIDHRVAQGDQRVDRADRQAVNQLLNECVHLIVACHWSRFARRLPTWESRYAW